MLNFAITEFSEVRLMGYVRPFRCENRERRETRRMPMTLVRVNNTVRGGFPLLNLQMVTRMKCSGFDEGRQEHRAYVFFSDGGEVQLVGEDADWVLSELDDLADATSD
jgi:hypothetical protein